MSNGSADKDDPLSEAAEEPAEEESLPTISSLDELTQLSSPIELTVESRAHGWRLDHYLSRLFANHSRAQLQKAIECGSIRLNGLETRSSRRLRVNDRIWVELPDAEQSTIPPEDLPLSVIYEDEALIVLNKAANMIVHPGRGNYRGTLAGALQFHFDKLSDVAGRHRPGIVHRLDRDTSGVILVAKDNQVHQRLSAQFEQREVRKEYRAIVRGVPELASDHIRTFMCVHPRAREKMMVCPEGGNAREAKTFYKVAERFLNRYAFVELYPSTGRTHQLRVHMQFIGTPILADKLYTGQTEFRRSDVLGSSYKGVDDEILLGRQALHAFRLTIRHPLSGKEMQFEAPFPEDFERTLEFLRSQKA